MPLTDILQNAVTREASDVLVVAGLPVDYKINGRLCREGEKLFPAQTLALTQELYSLAGRDMTKLLDTGDDDFSFAVSGLSRFRVNALRQRGSLALVIRVVSFNLPDRHALGIPDNVMAFADYPHGLVLVTGPAGSGKTTTLACLVDHVNSTREAHVVTIEDPIEYLHQHKMSVVTQRELYTDTASYDAALRAALREAPDIIPQRRAIWSSPPSTPSGRPTRWTASWTPFPRPSSSRSAPNWLWCWRAWSPSSFSRRRTARRSPPLRS